MLDKYKLVLVTGGAGFIGSHICDLLLMYGKKVIAMDNLSTGKRENLSPEVEFVEADISNRNEVFDAIQNIDLVFHVAAQPLVQASVEDPLSDFESNAFGTLNMLQAAAHAKVKKFVYTSTSAVFGEPKGLPVNENQTPEPLAPYGVSKLSAEKYCLVFNRIFGLPCTCLRPFNVYGPRENLAVTPDEVGLYAYSALKNKPVTVSGDGSQTRDFVYVKDVAHAHILAAERDESNGQVINIGTGIETSIIKLINEIERVTGSRLDVKKKPWPIGDIKREYADTRRCRELLGYVPQTPLTEGIKAVISSLKQ